MEWIANALRHHPELALFLALAVGYAIGKFRSVASRSALSLKY